MSKLSLQQMLRLANGLLARAREGIKSFPQLGVTLVLHQAEMRPGATHMAVVTTLPNRAAQRMVLAEALAQMVMADSGGSLEGLSDVCSDDVAYLNSLPLKDKS